MDKQKYIKDLKQGDTIHGKNGEKIEIISNNLSELFYYNAKTRLFKTIKIKNILYDIVFLF